MTEAPILQLQRAFSLPRQLYLSAGVPEAQECREAQKTVYPKDMTQRAGELSCGGLYERHVQRRAALGPLSSGAAGQRRLGRTDLVPF